VQREVASPNRCDVVHPKNASLVESIAEVDIQAHLSGARGTAAIHVNHGLHR